MPDDTKSWFLRNPVSSMTHLVWCLWAIGVTLILWRLSRGDRKRQLAVGCFGLSAILLYAASGVYHAVPAGDPELLAILLRLDHSMIYVLIAGSYTPVFAVLLRGRLRVACLCLVWALAAAGIACKWLVPWPPYWLTVSMYIALGWVGLVSVVPLLRAVGLAGMALPLLSGTFYMVGGVCDTVCWPVLVPGIIGYHEIMHVFDMAGTLTHVYFILRYIIPFRA